MSTAQEKAREKIEAIRQRNAAVEAPAVEPVEGEKKGTDKRRHTVDMTLDRHRKWARWRLDAGDEAGISTLSGQEAFMALLATLFTDETVSRRVIAKLKSGDY